MKIISNLTQNRQKTQKTQTDKKTKLENTGLTHIEQNNYQTRIMHKIQKPSSGGGVTSTLG